MEAFRNFRLIWEMVAENSIDHFEDFTIIFIWKNNLKKLKFPSIMIKNLHYKGNISDIHRNHYSIDMCNKHHRKGKRLFWFKKIGIEFEKFKIFINIRPWSYALTKRINTTEATASDRPWFNNFALLDVKKNEYNYLTKSTIVSCNLHRNGSKFFKIRYFFLFWVCFMTWTSLWLLAESKPNILMLSQPKN